MGLMGQTVRRETPRLNSASNSVQALQKNCGNRGNRKKRVKDYLKVTAGNSSYTEQHVRHSFDYINKACLQRIIGLCRRPRLGRWKCHRFLGSRDESRRSWIYAFSFFLNESLHADPANTSKLLKLIDTPKCYNDFRSSVLWNNSRQNDYYDAISPDDSADYAHMLTGTDDEIKARQRDMDALKKWMNALIINKALPVFITWHSTDLHTYPRRYIQQL